MFFSFYKIPLGRLTLAPPKNQLEELTVVHLFGNQRALDALSQINYHLDAANDRGLSRLLRHHTEEEISTRETYLRDNIDFFIRYFSLVNVGYLIGYFEYKDVKSLEVEIAYYLGNAAIKRFYTKNYPLLHPQILLSLVLLGEPFVHERPSKEQSDRLFNQFLSLNQSLESPEIEQFLYFLDEGENDNANLNDVNNLLREPDTMMKFLEDIPDESALNQAIRGFFDYLEFLENFRDFLHSTDNRLCQSVFWHYHGYWFLRMRNKMERSLDIFFEGAQAVERRLASNSQAEAETQDFLRGKRGAISEMLKELLYESPYARFLPEEYEKWLETAANS